MRNKFSELVNAGVASFHHEPIAPELPNNPTGDYMSRLYNMYWGAATDSHMDISQEGRLLIKGRITQDPCKWETLMFSPTWGGISWCQSGYCTLGEFLHANNVQPVVAMHNGEQGIELITKEEIPAQFTAPAAVTTTESKIPQPIHIMGDTGAIQEAFESAHNTKQLVENLNNSRWIAGDKWFACEGKVACTYDTPNGMITYIIEANANRGNIIQDEEFRKLMAAEGLDAVKLVQYDKYFRLESDDKKWDALLNKWKDNKIKEKSFNAMSSQDWVDRIKWMLSVFN